MEKIYKVTQETERTVKPTKAKFCLHCLHCKALVSEVLTTGWCLTFYTATSHQFPSLNFPCQRSSAMKLRRKESRAFQVPDCDPRLTRPHHTPMGTAWPGSSHLAGSSWDSAPANTTRTEHEKAEPEHDSVHKSARQTVTYFFKQSVGKTNWKFVLEKNKKKKSKFERKCFHWQTAQKVPSSSQKTNKNHRNLIESRYS